MVLKNREKSLKHRGDMFRSSYNLLIADFVRIFVVLPMRLRFMMVRMFGYMLLLALMETGTLLAISLLGMSISSPDYVRNISVVRKVFQLFPELGAWCADQRILAASAASLVLSFIVFKNGLSIFNGWACARFSEEIALYAGKRIFHQYLYSPYMAHVSGDSTTTFQALSWRGTLSSFVVNSLTMYTYFITAIFLLCTLIAASPEMLLLIIAVVIFISWGIYASIKKKIDNASAESARLGMAETAATRNAMQGIREVLIYRQQEVFLEKFMSACRSAVPSKTFQAIASPIPPWILEIVGFAVIPIVIIVMIVSYNADMAKITAAVSMVMLAAWRILPILSRSLASLVMLRSARQPAFACLEKLEEAQHHPVALSGEPTEGFQITREICFDDVSFTYPKATEPALQHIFMDIPCGKRIGIIGRSGAGKSTLVGILSGLMDCTSGQLLVDGKALPPADRAAYAMKVGYVPQAPYILAGTVAENVAFSQWGKPYDAERVLHACRQAALDIVESHASGIEIPIGEHGAGLSGGQAQRVSIARALYANPSLLIFDEATSALDHATENTILKTIYELANSMTVVIIAHRLSTVEQCDMIYWIDQGQLMASGTPDEILPLYRSGNGKIKPAKRLYG